MADFCNYCFDYMFGDKVNNGEPDIDVYKIFETLKQGFYQPCLCEGCNLRAIANIDGKLKVMWDDSKDWEDYRDRKERYENEC